jgi:hypothetical protein
MDARKRTQSLKEILQEARKQALMERDKMQGELNYALCKVATLETVMQTVLNVQEGDAVEMKESGALRGFKQDVLEAFNSYLVFTSELQIEILVHNHQRTIMDKEELNVRLEDSMRQVQFLENLVRATKIVKEQEDAVERGLDGPLGEIINQLWKLFSEDNNIASQLSVLRERVLEMKRDRESERKIMQTKLARANLRVGELESKLTQT